VAEVKRKFVFTVEGQYYGAHDVTGSPTVKGYVAKFMLPSQEAALSIICKYLLDPYLKKHFGDYARFRTHRITSVVTEGRLPDPKVLQMAFEDMGIQDLDDFCIIKQIFIDPYKSKNIEAARTAIAEAWHARESQVKADKNSGAEAEKVEADKLLAMNDLKGSTAAEINPNEMKIAKALEKSGGAAKASDPGAETVVEPAAEEDLLK